MIPLPVLVFLTVYWFTFLIYEAIVNVINASRRARKLERLKVTGFAYTDYLARMRIIHGAPWTWIEGGCLAPFLITLILAWGWLWVLR